MIAPELAAEAPSAHVGRVARALDEAVMEILRAQAEGRMVTELRVSETLYSALARAKASEVARGNPLTLLDLDVVDAGGLDDELVEVA